MFLLKKIFRTFRKTSKLLFAGNFPAGIYIFKVNNRNTRIRCEISSKLAKKTMMSLLLTLNIFHTLL